MSNRENFDPGHSSWPWTSLLVALGWIVLFSVIYSQAPLYTSNQNQYMLHGAAGAGVGFLESDWLANTVDPTPVFSALVELTFRIGLPALFHIYYIGLLGVYLYSMWALLQLTLKPRWTRLQSVIMMALLIAAHSFALRYALSRVFGQEWRFVLEGGFAGQRLLGTVFQPSTFGVLFLLGLVLYLRQKPILAVLSVVLAPTIHPTYLLTASLLILSFMVVSLRRTRSIKEPLLIGATALVLVSPILWYTWSNFQPNSARLTQLASQILVEERIPNHILLEEWLDLSVLLQGALIVIAVYNFRKQPIGTIMGIIAVAIFILTVFQIESDNQRLGLFFPWRPSALLVPMATSLLLGFSVDRIMTRINAQIETYQYPIVAQLGATLIFLAGLGIGSFVYDLRQKKVDAARPMMEFVETYKREDDRFFIPPKLQDFRLATGAPILVDFKSIPYVDTEVIEWYDRIRIAQYFYRDEVSASNCAEVAKAVELGAVNHVVLGPDQHGLRCPIFGEQVYSDDSYQVYKILK